MLDAIWIGVASGAVISLALDVIGHAESLAIFFRKLQFWHHLQPLRGPGLASPPKAAAPLARGTQR